MSCAHCNDVIMGAIASQITSLMIVFSNVYSDADQRKDQSSASLAFVRGIYRGPVNSPHKWPVTRKMLPFDDVIVWTFHCGFVCQPSASRVLTSHFLKTSRNTWHPRINPDIPIWLMVNTSGMIMPRHGNCFIFTDLLSTVDPSLKEPVIWSFDNFFALRLNKLFNKH